MRGASQMVKLMIVEDEAIIREGIVQMLDWKAYQIEICGAAINGKEALELFKTCPPDLLLTDIRMPQMDGLELIKQAKQLNSSFLPIILSGYNDFDYARQGMLLGAVDYILKPCRPEELLQTILSAKEQWEEQQQQDQALQQLQHTWTKNRALARQQKLTQWIEKSYIGAEDRTHIIQELELSLLPERLQIGVITIDQQTLALNYEASDWEKLRFAIMNILDETLYGLYYGKLESFPYQQQIVWCANIHPAMSNEQLIKQLHLLQSHIKHYLKLSISIGIGSIAQHIDLIHESYQQANQMSETRFLKGTGSIYIFQHTGHELEEYSSILVNRELNELEDQIFASIAEGQYNSTLDLIECWLERIRLIGTGDKQNIQLKMTSFMLELQKLIFKEAESSFEWKNEVINWVDRLPQVETFEELTVVLKKMIQGLFEAVSGRRTLHRTVQAALDIIHERYQTNLSLEMVAREVFVSNTYLSTLFKQELGVNFLDYVHQFRIEQSKTLLLQQLKIFAVAKLVGYQDERHFSHTFKKWMGITPSQYQKKTH